VPQNQGLPHAVRFGPFELDLVTGELRRSGLKLRLQDQPFRILALLVQRPGELVTREQLREALWPDDVFVDVEHGLNVGVAKLRHALGDTPRHRATSRRWNAAAIG
jgi:DNA-binding winged helix-turn-helix (wHTH) protein